MDPESDVDIALPHDNSAPGLARKQSRDALDGWHLRALLEPVLLIVSELVTNAVRHGTPPVRLGLSRKNHRVRIQVSDGGHESATGQLPGVEAESGRGLFLVDALSETSGVEKVPGDGKVSWAVVSEASTSTTED